MENSEEIPDFLEEEEEKVEELRIKTQKLVKEMQIQQKNLSNEFQQKNFSFFKNTHNSMLEESIFLNQTLDSRPLDDLHHDLLVRSYDLKQQNTTKQKLVALGKKRHQRKNVLETSFCSDLLPDRQNQETLLDVSFNSEPEFQQGAGNTRFSPIRLKAQYCLPVDPRSNVTLNDCQFDTQPHGTLPVDPELKAFPNAVSGREIIDKNISVESGEVLDEIRKEHCASIGLNYSYPPLSDSPDRPASLEQRAGVGLNYSYPPLSDSPDRPASLEQRAGVGLNYSYPPLSDSPDRPASLEQRAGVGLNYSYPPLSDSPDRPASLEQRASVGLNYSYPPLSDSPDRPASLEQRAGVGLNYSYPPLSASPERFASQSDLDVLRRLDRSEEEPKCNPREKFPEMSSGSNTSASISSNYKAILSDPGNRKRSEKSSRKPKVDQKIKSRTTRPVDKKKLSKLKEHRLLGYDWIASVLDRNHDASLEISDDYFEELREFWKEQQGKPIQDLHLLQKFVDESEEEELIQNILEESKIQPYFINNRLFPERIHKTKPDGMENQKPVWTSPRFVSVTVPNNTVQVDSPIKSHRRGSVDSSDTLSLGKHCVLGWESCCVNVPEVGSTLSMKDATCQPKTKQVLTLQEAETLAKGTTFRPSRLRGFFADKTNIYTTNLSVLDQDLDPDRLMSKQKTALSLEKKKKKDKRSDFLRHVAAATNPEGESENNKSQGTDCSVRSTSQLLDSAYSLMRDFERINQEHRMKRLAKKEQGGIP